MPVLLAIFLFLSAWAATAAEALVLDLTHSSEVLRESRHFRIFLPPDYGETNTRYPVIYWFHGYSERYNRPVTAARDRNYDRGSDYGGDTIASYVGTHPVIVVKLDGYNPRTPDEPYLRPWNIGPVETARQFPYYFPEIVSYIDAGYRTIPDREHRGTAGLSMGGFMSYWVAGKYPDLVASASNFMGSSEFVVGNRGIDVEYRHDEMHNNYGGVRTRLVTGARDFIQFYHRRMNAIWNFTSEAHETEDFDFDHGTPGMAKTLDFHMRAFAHPLPRPILWDHIDVYPYFRLWGWDIASDRRHPGFTILENVSRIGFRSSVREWVPSGALMPKTTLTVSTDRYFLPDSPQSVTIIHLRDGKVHHAVQNADAEGRLSIELDGDETEVGISSQGLPALAGYRLEFDSWAVPRKLVRIRARFWNKGAATMHAQPLRWETSNSSVVIQPATGMLPTLAAGASIEVPLSFTVFDETREIVKLYAVVAGQHLPLEIQIFPDAPVSRDFRVADGRTFNVYQRATELQELALGTGNKDGRASPGETIAILLPDGPAFRAAELFTNDPCIDNTARESDSWAAYDHVGASAKYSLPTIRRGCPAGHVVRFLARVQLPNKPNHNLRYATIELPIR